MSKYVREIDSIQGLRNTPTSDAAAAHVRTPTGKSGVFVPYDNDPFGRGDDGAVAVQASDGAWWVRKDAAESGHANVKWWGAKPDSSGTDGTDSTEAIQSAVDFATKNGRTLRMPDPGNGKGYRITEPIVIDAQDRWGICGAGEGQTKIWKDGNTKTGLSSRTFDGETIPYDVDAFFVLAHEDGTARELSFFAFRDLWLVNPTGNNPQYGIYAPACKDASFELIQINEVNTGLYFDTIFFSEIDRCSQYRGEKLIFINNNRLTQISTSTDIKNCGGTQQQTRTYDLRDLHYSEVSGCSSDQCVKDPYFIENCDITISSSGLEAAEQIKCWTITASRVTMTGCYASRVIPDTSNGNSHFNIVNSRVVITSYRLRSVDGTLSGPERQMSIRDGARVTSIHHLFQPSLRGPDVASNSTLHELTFQGVLRDNRTLLTKRVSNADLGNTPNTGDPDTDDLINALVDVITTHGLGGS